MTLNSVMAAIWGYLTKIGIFGVNYVTVVEVRPILLATKM